MNKKVVFILIAVLMGVLLINGIHSFAQGIGPLGTNTLTGPFPYIPTSQIL